MEEVTIVGGGLAGCEAAWFLANRRINVVIYEMRPEKTTPAHVSEYLGELVCSNSLKSEDPDTAAGLLKNELRAHGSLMMIVAEKSKVPAGSALAVDRELFGKTVTDMILSHPNIKVIRQEVRKIPSTGKCILACGPLASASISENIMSISGGALYFVDAISPVVSADSVNINKGFFAGRYGKGGDDYLNLPMSEDEFNRFFLALSEADLVKNHDFEDVKVFERCMPLEIMASRGRETMLFGPLRPVGLEDPITGKRFYAVVQLRFENKDKTAYNIVGFQTKMTIPSQKEVFRLIPGLENAEFLRYGTIHRNTYIDAPLALNPDQSFKQNKDLFLAGQVTGVEGYLESMSSGVIAAVQLLQVLRGNSAFIYPIETAFGSLQRHIRGEFGGKNYSPSNFHFGMLPPLDMKIRDKSKRKAEYTKRAMEYYQKGLLSNEY